MGRGSRVRINLSEAELHPVSGVHVVIESIHPERFVKSRLVRIVLTVSGLVAALMAGAANLKVG